jgi:hypothetical protein
LKVTDLASGNQQKTLTKRSGKPFQNRGAEPPGESGPSTLIASRSHLELSPASQNATLHVPNSTNGFPPDRLTSLSTKVLDDPAVVLKTKPVLRK